VAPRRLLIIVLIMLGVLSAATALAPQQSQDSKTPTTTTATQVEPTATTPESTRSGALLAVTIDADDPATRSIPRRVTAGDQLQLSVTSTKPDQVEIPAFGQVEPVTPFAPAYFDLLLDKPGIYEVRLLDAGRVAGVIEVSPVAQRESARGKDRAHRASR
jgi:hypothetical protein